MKCVTKVTKFVKNYTFLYTVSTDGKAPDLFNQV